MYTPTSQPEVTPVQLQQTELKAVPKKVAAKSKAGDVGGFIQQCISLCSYIKDLETQSHLIHLNYEGANFLGVHAFLKDQYESHLAQFDTLGEYIRSMDYLLPMCANGLADAGPGMKHVTSYKGTDQLSTYYKNLEELANKAKKLEKAAAKIGAVDIQNYMADIVGQSFKAAWFIKATLRNN